MISSGDANIVSGQVSALADAQERDRSRRGSEAPEPDGRRVPEPSERPTERAQWDEVEGRWVEWDEASGRWVELPSPVDGDPTG